MATESKTIPILCDRKDVVLIKPAEPTPSDTLSLSTIDNDHNLELLCQTLYVYQANAGLKPNPDPASVVKEALSRVLIYYYPLAGKLKRHSDGQHRITCNADGVPFMEATTNVDLSSLNYLDGVDLETAKMFVFDSPSDSEFGYHPFVVQVTKFSCGGFTIGMGLSHSVCDGFGAGQLFRALAELASGRIGLTVKPVWERERLVGKPVPFRFLVEKADFSSSPFLPASELVHECFKVDGESIRRLKTRLLSEESETEKESEVFTTLEALGAYVWRARFRALRLNPEGKTLFCLAMGIRNLLDPPLPEGYYGNAFSSADVVLTGRELNEWPISKTARMIKESKRICSNVDRIWNSINMIETMVRMNIKLEPSGGAMVLTDWRRLGLTEDANFGWRTPMNMIPLPWNTFGYVDLCMFLPPCGFDCSMKGGVRVLVSLPPAAMVGFKEEMDALKIGDRGDF